MDAVVGRESELDAIERWLDAPAPAILLIEGEVGIGKTTLWQATVARAGELGMRILVSVATEPEARLSYSGLGDILGPVVAETATQLPPPQRRALEIALLLRDPGGRPPDERAVAVATLGAIRATGTPTLIAIDDAQWLDRASSEALAYSFRRIQPEDAVHVVISRRHGLAGGLDAAEEQRLDIGPLSVGAIRRVVLSGLGASLTRPSLLRIHAASGGNPLYALELARAELTADRIVTGDRTPTLSELAQQRLAAMPGPTRNALLLVAAASDPSPSLLSVAIGSDALDALAPALDVGLVELSGRTIRFSHPILASAIYADSAEHLRHAAHGRLARAAPSVEERGHHLALGTIEPNDEVAAAVEAAGASARGRGARADAAELFERAAELTTERDRAGHARRLAAAADSYFASGGAHRALDLLEQAAELDVAVRPEALWQLARIRDETEGFDRTRPEWEEALHTEDLGLVVNVRRSMALAGLFVDGETALGDALAGVEAAERLGDARPLALALAMEAYVRGVLGDRTYLEPLERALALEGDVAVDELHSPSAVLADLGRLSLDLDAGRRGYEAVLQRAEEVGDARTETWCAYGLGMVETLAGNLTRGAELAARATELSEQVTLLGLPAVRLSALVAASRGEVEHCRELLDACGATAREMGDKVNLLGTLAIGGFLELSLGAAAAAIEPLSEARTIQDELGIQEPGVTRFLVDLSEALSATGRPDEGEQAITVFRTQVDQLGRTWGRPLISRAEGLVLASRGDTARGLARLEAAVNDESLLPMPLERARTLLELGSMQRRERRRREARETLRRALEMFDELGAVLWAGRAQAELARLGGRAPSEGGLTPTEQRVAALVSEGRSNKEVAADLVVSVHTVEAALTSIYRKLDVHSRTEMARKLTAEPVTDASKH